MSLVVVGGHSRNIGKTSLACGIIAATKDCNWTAVKITLFGHGICSADGKPCSCAVDDPDHPFVINEEHDATGSHDTGRMLRAGARRALWVRAPQGRLGEAMPGLRERLGNDDQVLIESNSILDYMQADVYLPLLDYSQPDFKASTARLLARAAALVTVGHEATHQSWPSVGALTKPRFPVAPPDYCSQEVVEFVRRKGAE